MGSISPVLSITSLYTLILLWHLLHLTVTVCVCLCVRHGAVRCGMQCALYAQWSIALMMIIMVDRSDSLNFPIWFYCISYLIFICLHSDQWQMTMDNTTALRYWYVVRMWAFICQQLNRWLTFSNWFVSPRVPTVRCAVCSCHWLRI